MDPPISKEPAPALSLSSDEMIEAELSSSSGQRTIRMHPRMYAPATHAIGPQMMIRNLTPKELARSSSSSSSLIRGKVRQAFSGPGTHAVLRVAVAAAGAAGGDVSAGFSYLLRWVTCPSAWMGPAAGGPPDHAEMTRIARTTVAATTRSGDFRIILQVVLRAGPQQQQQLGRTDLRALASDRWHMLLEPGVANVFTD